MAGGQQDRLSAGHRQQRGSLPRCLLSGGGRTRRYVFEKRAGDLQDHVRRL